MPAELPTPIDLCLHYPEQTGTNQLEHYCDIVLRLFDASCVVLRFTQDKHVLNCYPLRHFSFRNIIRSAYRQVQRLRCIWCVKVLRA